MAIGTSNGVRVRFAPSPTGGPHVGNIRTAIYDWLLARGSGGAFVIRVEDTDQGRKVEGAIDELLDALAWLGIEWDEGPDVGGPHAPYVQSERLGLYHDAIASLIEKGAAYRCYCTPERLSEMREQQQRDKGQIGYDRLCKSLSEDERRERQAAGLPSVVRFAMPSEGVTRLDDIVRGEVSFENGLVDDFVMLKGDRFPTYHLANVVDDHLMEITHVLRAEEWLPSAPRHLQIYKALGWEAPVFAHLPVILAPDRSKLSKRHGATSIMEYREQGYIAPALVNFLTLLGWSLDDKTEIMSSAELKENFSLERVSRSGALFDAEKLAWMNGHYIREMSDENLADALLEYWGRYPVSGIPGSPDRAVVVKITPLVKERLKTLADAAPLVRFFFADQIRYEAAELVQKKMDVPGTKAALDGALVVLQELAVFDTESIETALRALAEELGIKVGQLLGSIRIATTGLKVAPPLFETLEILGRGRSVSAVRAASEQL
jgi:glutamyl-tRNA synthetase